MSWVRSFIQFEWLIDYYISLDLPQFAHFMWIFSFFFSSPLDCVSLVCRRIHWQCDFRFGYKSLWTQDSIDLFGYSKGHQLVDDFICSKHLLLVRIESVVWHGCRWYNGDGSTLFRRNFKWSVNRNISLIYLILMNKWIDTKSCDKPFFNDFHKKIFSFCYRVRGAVGSTNMLIFNFGVFLAFLLGNFFDYFMTPKVMIALLFTFVSAFMFFPESPIVLVKQNKIKVKIIEIWINTNEIVLNDNGLACICIANN